MEGNKIPVASEEEEEEEEEELNEVQTERGAANGERAYIYI